jgi:hypothetical protein
MPLISEFKSLCPYLQKIKKKIKEEGTRSSYGTGQD